MAVMESTVISVGYDIGAPEIILQLVDEDDNPVTVRLSADDSERLMVALRRGLGYTL